jgi:hypothetical protein
LDETRNAYKILVRKYLDKRSLKIPKRRWEDNIKTDICEAGFEDGRWMEILAYCFSSTEPSGSSITGNLSYNYLSSPPLPSLHAFLMFI